MLVQDLCWLDKSLNSSKLNGEFIICRLGKGYIYLDYTHTCLGFDDDIQCSFEAFELLPIYDV